MCVKIVGYEKNWTKKKKKKKTKTKTKKQKKKKQRKTLLSTYIT